MNQFDPQYYGGHKLTIPDIGFLQTSYQEVFKALVNVFSDPNQPGFNPSFLIKGCSKSLQTAGVWSISEGFIVMYGEVFYVPEHNVSFDNENDPLYWFIDQTSVFPSPVEYKDFQMREVHLQRRAKVSTTVTDIPFGLPSVRAMLDKRQRGKIGTIEGLNGWTGVITYVKAHGRVSLYGILTTSSNTTHGNVMFQLPADLTPYCPGFGYLGSAPAVGSLIAGTISLVMGAGGSLPHTALRVFLNGSTPTSYTPWPITVEPQNLTSSPPRMANVKALNPVTIPGGSDTVVYNFNGISWDIAPE